MELYEKNGNILYILNILRKYTDENHMLSAADIQRKIKEIYDVDIDTRTIRRNINLLKYKLEYDISTRDENKVGYYITKNPDTDFEVGEIRAIIDNFCYASYIVPSVAKSIIAKCKSMQNIYENQKLTDYKIYTKDNKTDNMEVIKNIEDISNAIHNLSKITFEYLKYDIVNGIVKKVVASRTKVTPFAIVYDRQQFYMIAVKEGKQDFFNYRLDRIKNVKELDEKRDIKKTNSEIKNFVESTVDMFGGQKEEIEAICDMYLLDNVYETFGKEIIVNAKGDEEFRLKLFSNTEGFKFWVLRNIESVEVLKPIALRNDIKEILNSVSEKYNK